MRANECYICEPCVLGHCFYAARSRFRCSAEFILCLLYELRKKPKVPHETVDECAAYIF